MAGFLKVELLHSAIARDQRQKDTLRGLGLRRRHQQRILEDTPAIRGMIRKVYDLVRFETVASKTAPKREVLVTYKLGPVPDASKAKPVSKTQARKAAKASAKVEAAKTGKKKTSGDKKTAAKAEKPAKAAKKAPAKKSKG